MVLLLLVLKCLLLVLIDRCLLLYVYSVQVRLGRLTSGSTKAAKNVLDDLLSSNEGGKHDYDW